MKFEGIKKLVRAQVLDAMQVYFDKWFAEHPKAQAVSFGISTYYDDSGYSSGFGAEPYNGDGAFKVYPKSADPDGGLAEDLETDMYEADWDADFIVGVFGSGYEFKFKRAT